MIAAILHARDYVGEVAGVAHELCVEAQGCYWRGYFWR